MKKTALFFALVLAPLLMLGLPALAQDPAPPDSWLEVISDFNLWFAGLGGLAALTVFVAAGLITLLKVTTGWLRQLLSWVVAIVLSLLAWLLNLGFFAEVESFWNVFIYGIAIGFVSNGIFDIDLVKSILNALGLEKG